MAPDQIRPREPVLRGSRRVLPHLRRTGLPLWHRSYVAWTYPCLVHFAAIDLGEAVPRLRASECQEWPYIVFVCGAKSIDIAAPKISMLHNVCASPGKHRHVLDPCEYVGHEPSVATVAIGKGMNGDQTMMKPDGDLIGRKGPVFEPIAGIAQ